MLNMLYETFNIYLKFQNIIDFCFGIIAVIVAKIILNIRNIIHIRNINRILELKNNKTEYTVSFFESEVWSSKIDNKKIKLVPHSESMIPIFIVNILNVSKNKSDISLCHLKDSQYKIDSTKNRFVCGGPFTNTDTYNIFMKYFPYIKFPCSTKNYIAACKNNITHVINTSYEINEDNSYLRKIYYTKEKKFIEFDSRYENIIFMSRLKASVDFDKNHGTVHIIFGTSAESTVQAFWSILNNADTIYDMVKKYKNNHYAFFIRMSHNKDVDFKNYVDITHTINIIGNPPALPGD